METKTILDPLMERLIKEKKVAQDFQNRRHEDWNDNYELYRNKVKTNRLTQRQAVNVPLMKETIKTLLSKIDEPPTVNFEELSGNEVKEIIVQEVWNNDYDNLNFEGIDIQDKKTVLLYGRAFKKLNFLNGEFDIDALDIYDVIVDPMVNPLKLESARFLIHQNIFKSLREILANEKYSSKGKNKLKTYLSTKEGIIQSNENRVALEKKQERLLAMGVDDKDFAQFSAGNVIVNLTEHYTQEWDAKKKEFNRIVTVYADNEIRLLKASLKELIGVDFYPFVTWGEDVETQDFWSDGPADLVRVPNKILNIFMSQMIENRTLKNFQMTWYDATVTGYKPQTYEPGPGRMLPAPGDPNKTLKAVEVSGLEDTLTQIDFLIKLIERGTSATAIEKGVSEKKQITLGEVEMLAGQAREKTMSMAKFYRRSWKELAEKWYKIREANVADTEEITLYKTSSKGKVWPKKVKGKDWKSESGYRIEVQSTSEQEAEKTSGVQKMMAIKNQFPDNPVVYRITQRKILELGEFSPEELREVEEWEKKKLEAPEPMAPAPAPAPETAQLAQTAQPAPAPEMAGAIK